MTNRGAERAVQDIRLATATRRTFVAEAKIWIVREGLRGGAPKGKTNGNWKHGGCTNEVLAETTGDRSNAEGSHRFCEATAAQRFHFKGGGTSLSEMPLAGLEGLSSNVGALIASAKRLPLNGSNSRAEALRCAKCLWRAWRD